MKPRYLGAGVYVDVNGEDLVLCTVVDDATTNIVYLTRDGLRELVAFARGVLKLDTDLGEDDGK